MPAYARREIVATDHIGVYHCIARCVRRAFLCGDDPVSGKNHDHRKGWIRDRLRALASVFAIEVCGYSVMSNRRGVIPRNLAPILDRLAINSDGWIETVRNFGRWFKRAVGRVDSLTSAALRTGRRWYQGQRAAVVAFQ